MTREPLDLMTLAQKANELSASVYQLTKTFPKDELNNLTRSLQDSSMTALCDIGMARGFICMSLDEPAHFLSKALGSTYQVQAQLGLAKTLTIGNGEMLRSAEALCIETLKMLNEVIAFFRMKD